MKGRRRGSQSGNVMVETALVLIPLVIGLIVAMEVARCMWTYHTLTSTIKRATRYASVHGARCIEATPACQATVGQVATLIKTQGVGLNPALLQLTMAAGASSRSCTTLASCLQDSSQWPPAPNNATGLPLTLTASYEFPSVLAYLLRGNSSNLIRFSARSTESIQF